MKGELDVRCNSVEKLQAFAPGLERSRKTDDQDIHVEWFLNIVVANKSFDD